MLDKVLIFYQGSSKCLSELESIEPKNQNVKTFFQNLTQHLVTNNHKEASIDIIKYLGKLEGTLEANIDCIVFIVKYFCDLKVTSKSIFSISFWALTFGIHSH